MRLSSRREIWSFLKGQVSSGTATAVDWSLVTSVILLGGHYILAVTAGAVGGAATDFFVKRHWVFDATQELKKKQAFRYAWVSGASALLNCGLAYLLIEHFGVSEIPGAIGGSALVGFAWNYPMHRLYVFRPSWDASK